LFGPHSHLQQLLNRVLPGFVTLEERVVLERVLGSLDVDFLQGVGGELVINDVLGRDAQEARFWNAEELREMRRVPRADLEGAVDV